MIMLNIVLVAGRKTQPIDPSDTSIIWESNVVLLSGGLTLAKETGILFEDLGGVDISEIILYPIQNNSKGLPTQATSF